MSNFLPFVKKNNKFEYKIKKHNDLYRKDPNYFLPTGIQVFYGDEGSGKTLCLMHIYERIKRRYPYAKTVSNINLLQMKPISLKDHETEVSNIDENYYQFRSKEDFLYTIKSIRNGTNGVIQLNDEYQNYFSNQDSRNVPPSLIEQSAQNRKQRRIMLCTSQDYDQLAKPIRRRADNAIRCKTYSLPYFGTCLTVYWVYNNNRQTGAKPLKMGWFFHSVALRDSYDTNQIIFTGDQSDGVYKASQQTLEIQPRSSSLKRKGGIFKKRR
jgi:hypothetical protein